MNLTALQSLPPNALYWIAGGIVLLIMLFAWWRSAVHSKTWGRYTRAWDEIERALKRTEPTYKQLTANPAGLVFQAPDFKGQTKTEYDRVRLTWLNWINLRVLAEERRKRADVLYAKHRGRPWWQIACCFNLKAGLAVLVDEPLSGTCSTLSELPGIAELVMAGGNGADMAGRISQEESAVAASFAAFNKTLADATALRSEFEQEFSNSADDERVGIDHLRTNLLKVGLALSPYEERLEKLTRLKDELSQLLVHDPVAASGQLAAALKQKIGMVRRTLRDAFEYKSTLEKLRERHQKVAEDAAGMQHKKPKSAIAEVRFSSNYSLDEPKFELLPLLAESARLLLELDTLLLDGHLVRFGRAQGTVEQAVDSEERMFVCIVEDKQRADEGFAKIESLSSPTDLTHDEPEHETLRQVYGAQKWHAAALAVDLLLQTCQKRADVRQCHGEMNGRLGELSARIRELSQVVSQRLDDRLGELQAAVADLGRRCQLPDGDCPRLKEEIAALDEKLNGAADSLQSALDAELAVHEEVTSRLAELVERMTDVTTRVADNWGGAQAAQQLGAVQPLLSPIVADGKKLKPDWSRLLERITELLAQVEPVRVLVYAEINRHACLTASVEAASRFVRSLSNQSYTRTARGVTYGAGIYCPSSGLTELVEQAEQELGRRLYDEAALLLRTLQQKVGRDHLECCWMVLQTMAHTSESSAVRYAHENGYWDGMFETWAEGHLKFDEEGFHLFQLPERVHDPVLRDVTLTLRAPKFDEPVTSDYEPAYAA